MERQETARLEAQALKKKEEFERFMARQVCAKPLVLLRRVPVRALFMTVVLRCVSAWRYRA